FWTGLIAATILLFKINIGVFALIAIALVVSLHLAGWPRARFSGLLILAASAFGVMLFFSTPSYSGKYFALTYLAALGTTVGVAIELSGHRQIRTASVPWLAAGFVVCSSVGFGVALAWGTTPRALFDNLVLGSLNLARAYH